MKMAEQRLIDANKLHPVHVENYGEVIDWSSIEYADEINLDDLPFVQKLLKQVQDLNRQLREWKFWYGSMREREAKELRENQAAVNVMRKHCEKTIAELREELARVTAERDAAVKDLEQAIDIYRDDEGWDLLCRFCNGKSCREKKECVPKWRGLKKEE